MSKSLLYGATKVDGSNSAYAAVPSLEQFQWSNRVLVIFADTDNQKASRQENLLLSERSGLAERDMVILRVRNGTVASLFGSAESLDAGALREELEEREEGHFAAILIGKDGSVKLRAVEPLPAEELFDTVDAMPMRAAEATRPHDHENTIADQRPAKET